MFDTAKLEERQKVYFEIRKAILYNCYTIEDLGECMLRIDSFTEKYGLMEGSLNMQEELLNYHNEQHKSVSRTLDKDDEYYGVMDKIIAAVFIVLAAI